MQMILAIGAGGAIGAVARYLMASGIGRWIGVSFPYGTLAVNVLGCFLMGVLVEYLALRFTVSPAVQAFVTTGLLGGFTTFSAFSLETVLLFERQAYDMALLYVLASVALSIGALVAGLSLTRMLILAG